MISALVSLTIATSGSIWQLPFLGSEQVDVVNGSVTALKFRIDARADGSLPLLNASYFHGWDGRRTVIYKKQPATGFFHIYTFWDAELWPAEDGKGILLTPGDYAYLIHNSFAPLEWGSTVLGGRWVDAQFQSDYWSVDRQPSTPTSIPMNSGGNASGVATFSVVPRGDGKVPLYEMYASSDMNQRLRLYKMDPSTSKYDVFYDSSSFTKPMKPGIVLEPGNYAQSSFITSTIPGPITYMVLATGRYVNP